MGTWAVLVVAGAFGGLGRVWVSLGSGLGWLIWCDFSLCVVVVIIADLVFCGVCWDAWVVG